MNVPSSVLGQRLTGLSAQVPANDRHSATIRARHPSLAESCR